jgi:hypothetical protein
VASVLFSLSVVNIFIPVPGIPKRLWAMGLLFALAGCGLFVGREWCKIRGVRVVVKRISLNSRQNQRLEKPILGIDAMNHLPTEWRPLTLDDLREEMSGFDDWILCGGHSVAVAVGRDSRPHGDIDIGVFRSQLLQCLGRFGTDRVFLCRAGRHEKWDGRAIPEEVHDIWICSRDGKSWACQVMVYDDEGDKVIYRSDRRITWPKHAHAFCAGGIKFLNPLVTVLFKAQSPELRKKDLHDLRELIANWPAKPPQAWHAED